ncbi:MAG: deoxyribonuclease IV [Candidatus Hodarchaeales archaeon]|jgi:deoxyribonuclease-4
MDISKVMKNKRPKVGAHKSIIKGIDKAIDRAVESTCETLQIFTRPPRRWLAGKDTLSMKSVKAFLKKAERADYTDTAIHMPYLPNLASPDDQIHKKSIQVLREELEKASLLKSPYVVSHLGSPKDETRKFAVKRVSESINQAFQNQKQPTMLLLENSTGKKRSWGKYIEDIGDVIELVEQKESVGICFDTAHAFASGYDISYSEGLHEVFDRIDTVIGFNKLRILHINDSRGKLDSGIDNHEHIGKGFIGITCFKELMQHPRFKSLSMILETPKDDVMSDKENLDLLKALRN